MTEMITEINNLCNFQKNSTDYTDVTIIPGHSARVCVRVCAHKVYVWNMQFWKVIDKTPSQVSTLWDHLVTVKVPSPPKKIQDGGPFISVNFLTQGISRERKKKTLVLMGL